MVARSMLIVVVVAAAGSTAERWASSLLPESQKPDTQLALQALEEVVTGPLAGRSLVLYLDPALGPQILQTIVGLFTLPIILVNLGSEGELWSQEQPLAVLRAEYLIHMAVFVSDPRPFFHYVTGTDNRWKPKYFLMFSVSQDPHGKIVKAGEFDRCERIVMFQHHRSNNISQNTKMEMLSYFPFSDRQQVVSLGLWSVDAELQIHDIFPDRFPSFEGYRFLLGTWFDDYPYLHQAKDKPEGEGDGVEVEILNALSSQLNFSFDLTTEPPDQLWGDFENGSWTGMLGMVYQGGKNFTVNYFGYTNKRIEDFDASVSYWMEGFGLALLKPKPLPKWRSVYYPFTPVVWASMALSFSLATTIFYLQDIAQIKPILGSVGRVWPYVLRPVLSHAVPRLPETYSQRVFVASWWLSCLILTTAYTANLIAFLTIPLYPKRLETVQQLAESDFRVSMPDYGEFVPQALKSSKDEYYRTLGEKLDLYAFDNESVFPVLDGTHAYIESYSYSRILFLDVYEARNVYMLKEQLYPGHLCWYFKKNTAWKYKFDHGLQQLVEAGLIAHWLQIKTEDYLGVDFENKLRLESTERSPALPLTIEHMQGLFFILLLGWSLSSASFAREIAHR